jgi:uncharacterized protein YecT (DUF1311 family)
VTRWLATWLVAAGLAPPVIHEPFTALPCPIHPDTTVDVEGCQEMRVLRTDRAIDREVKTIFALLPTRAARASFVAGEQSWLHYRRQSCTAEASFYGGGSGEPVAYLTCTLHRNRSHLADLAATEKTLRQH